MSCRILVVGGGLTSALTAASLTDRLPQVQQLFTVTYMQVYQLVTVIQVKQMFSSSYNQVKQLFTVTYFQLHQLFTVTYIQRWAPANFFLVR